MEDSDRNAIINFRYVGGFLMIAAIVLSFVLEKSSLSLGAVFFHGPYRIRSHGH